MITETNCPCKSNDLCLNPTAVTRTVTSFVGVVIGLLRLRVVDLNVNLLFFKKKKKACIGDFRE